MSSACEIRHSAYTRAEGKSQAWHDWNGGASSLEIVGDVISRNDSHGISEHRLTVKSPRLDHGLKIVFISDLHWAGAGASEYSVFAEEVSSGEPDFILFGGDLSMFSNDIDAAVRWLAKLHARQGKFAVPGNRESCLNWLDAEFWNSAFAHADFRYLCNETVEIGGITLCGIDDFRFGKPDWSVLRGVDRSRPVIAFTHNPDAAGSAGEETYLGDIVLCGHTHGGQICLPLLGPLYTSSMFGRQFLHGLKQRDDGALCLVSSGIGESGFGMLRRRVNCPREFVTFTMLPADD